MSTILKALKRVDEERRAEATPRSLEEQVLAGATAPRARRGAGASRGMLLAGGAAGVLVLAGAASWLTLREPAERAAPAAAMPQQPPQAAREPATARAPAPFEALEDVAFGDAESPALAPPASPLGETPLDGPGRRAQAETPPVPAPPPAARVAEVASSPPVAPAPAAAPEREPAPSERLAAADRRALAAPAAPRPAERESPPAATPRAGEVLDAPRSAATAPAESDVARAAAEPDVRVERTQWHPAPEKRAALVRIGADGDARELREGDALDGLVVKEIRPSGVVFLHDGVELRRGVGGG